MTAFPWGNALHFPCSTARPFSLLIPTSSLNSPLIQPHKPLEWQDDRPPAPSYLRILHLGKILQDDDTLTSESPSVLARLFPRPPSHQSHRPFSRTQSSTFPHTSHPLHLHIRHPHQPLSTSPYGRMLPPQTTTHSKRSRGGAGGGPTEMRMAEDLGRKAVGRGVVGASFVSDGHGQGYVDAW